MRESKSRPERTVHYGIQLEGVRKHDEDIRGDTGGDICHHELEKNIHMVCAAFVWPPRSAYRMWIVRCHTTTYARRCAPQHTSRLPPHNQQYCMDYLSTQSCPVILWNKSYCKYMWRPALDSTCLKIPSYNYIWPLWFESFLPLSQEGKSLPTSFSALSCYHDLPWWWLDHDAPRWTIIKTN